MGLLIDYETKSLVRLDYSPDEYMSNNNKNCTLVTRKSYAKAIGVIWDKHSDDRFFDGDHSGLESYFLIDGIIVAFPDRRGTSLQVVAFIGKKDEERRIKGLASKLGFVEETKSIPQESRTRRR